MRAYLIDDEKMYFKLLNPILKKAGHTLGYALSGKEALENIAAFDPDVIILDLRIPDMSGFEILERLRADPHFSHVPVIFVSGKGDLEDKVKALEMGAEDYMTKPFTPEELVARLGVLARRREFLRVVEEATADHDEGTSEVIAVHSLRGGVGCTSLCLNLAIGYYKIWSKSTLVIDVVLTSGQVAMLLNASPRVTWEDLAEIKLADIDNQTISELVHLHKSGIRYIASPKLPATFNRFPEFFSKVLLELRKYYDMIVLDLPHDFSDVAVIALDNADYIVHPMAPEMASLRATVCALTTYDSLGYSPEKIKILMNNTSQATSLKISHLEKAIGRKIDIELPYAPEVIQAINYGEPFIIANPKLPISMRVEEFAHTLSQELLKNIPPAAPTEAWRQVTRRMKADKKSNV